MRRWVQVISAWGFSGGVGISAQIPKRIVPASVAFWRAVIPGRAKASNSNIARTATAIHAKHQANAVPWHMKSRRPEVSRASCCSACVDGDLAKAMSQTISDT